MEKLQQLYIEDYYRQKLKQGNNREILAGLTGLDRQELEAFMFYCKYSDTYISTLNDYDFLVSLMSCYNQYQRDQEVNQLIEEQAGSDAAKKSSERFKD